MNNHERIEQIITEATGEAKYLGYHRIYVDLTKDVKAAIFLNQCVYWSDKGKRSDGYFYKSDKEWADELGLSTGVVERIRKDLVDRGFIHTTLTRANGAPTTHYLVDIPFIEQSIKQLCEKQQMDISETKESDLVKIDKSITENTHHITHQNTTNNFSSESSSLSHSGKESISSEGETQGQTQQIDTNVLSDWEEWSHFPSRVLEVCNATSLTQEEKEHLYKIEAKLYDGEIGAEGWDEAHTWRSDKYELKYVQDKLKFAKNKLEEGKSLTPSSIIRMIEKPENREKWRDLKRPKRH